MYASRFFVLLLAFFLTGCSVTAHETWKSTKKLYATYLNQPASLDYEDKGMLSSEEGRLAIHLFGIDNQLEELEHFLENQDRPPTKESVSLFFARFPWLSGLVAVNADGEVLAQEPPVAMKPLDFSLITQQESRKDTPRGLRGYVQDTPLGPEVMMGMPIYESAILRGFLICHFDIRSLLRYVDKPEELVVLSPEAVLWPGHFDYDSTPLAHQDWTQKVKSTISGSCSDQNGSFSWLARFLGKTPLIFAAPVQGTFATAQMPDQNTFLSRTRNLPVTESQLLENNQSLLLTPPPPDIPAFAPEEKSIDQ